MTRCRTIWILALCMILTSLFGAETLLVGDVVNERTGEPIPNAHVYFRGTKIGTATDTTGAFCLRVDLNVPLKLKVSAVGFHTELFEIQPGATVGMYVPLRERTGELEDVFVFPGLNPALALMDSVRAHAPADHQLSLADPRSQTDCFFLRRHNSDPVPLSFVESLGIPVPARPDFYLSLIPIGSASILSPLARSGNTYYRYFLADSMRVDSPAGQSKVYRIDFIPRHGADLLLRGALYVDSASYRLTRIESSLPYRANINFVRSLAYSADYANGYLCADSLDMVYDFSAFRDTLSRLPALRLRRTSSPLPTSALPSLSQSPLSAPATPLPPLQMDSSVFQTPIYRTAQWLAYAIQTGCFSTGTWLDLGNYTEFLRYSSYEGLHLGLPFRTSAKLLKSTSFDGYVAYGFRDRGVKWRAGVQTLLPTSRRHLLGGYVWDRYVYRELNEFSSLAHENSHCYGNQSFTSYLLGDVFNLRPRGLSNSAARRREFRMWWEADWCDAHGALPAVETQLSFSYNRQAVEQAAASRLYDHCHYFRFAEASALFRLSWGERTVDVFTSRRHVYSRFPTLWLGATLGTWNEADVLAPGRLYGRIHLSLRQDIPLGVGGQLEYLASVGCVLGSVPYDLLDFMDGSTGVTFEPYRFTLMGRNAYCADRYLKLQAHWNGHGILFNRIPYVCRAKLRELAEFKLAWGGLSSHHVHLPNSSDSDTSLRALSSPYVEVGVGIGNILSVGEVWCIVRCTRHTSPLVTDQPWVACRFRLHIGL